MNETLTALIEAAEKERNGNTFDSGDAVKTYMAAREAIPALRASLARDTALEQYMGELRSYRGAVEGYDECADRLTQILEGRK